MTDLRLLSLDFDGTMVGPWSEGKAAVSEELVKCLAALRKSGVLLAINTGRTLALVDQAMETFPSHTRLRPDYRTRDFSMDEGRVGTVLRLEPTMPPGPRSAFHRSRTIVSRY